jgi:hypothetical protein
MDRASMSRRRGRSGRRTTAGMPAGGTGVVYGLTGFDVSNILQTAAAGGLTCPDAGYWMRVLHRVTSQAVSAQRRILNATASADNAGCLIRINGFNASLEATGRFTGPVPVTTPTFTITAAMVGKLLDTVAVWDKAAGLLRLYVNGVEVGSGTSSLGLAALPNATVGTAWGVRPATAAVPADANDIFASEGGDGFTPSAAEIYAAHWATRQRVRSAQVPFAGIAGKTTWRAQIGAAWDPPTSITAEVGGNMTMTAGAASGLALATLTAPQWA